MNNEGRVDEKIFYTLKTDPAKKTYPGPKQIYRILENGLIKSDFIALENEEKLPVDAAPVLQKILDKGNILSKMPNLNNNNDNNNDFVITDKVPFRLFNQFPSLAV